MAPAVPMEREITVRGYLCNTTGLASVRDAPIQYLKEEFRDIMPDTGLISPPDRQPDNIRRMVEVLAKLPLEPRRGLGLYSR